MSGQSGRLVLSTHEVSHLEYDQEDGPEMVIDGLAAPILCDLWAADSTLD